MTVTNTNLTTDLFIQLKKCRISGSAIAIVAPTHPPSVGTFPSGHRKLNHNLELKSPVSTEFL